MARIGVLALQGDFREHARLLDELGAEAVEVRLPDQVPGLDALVIPGGESTTISLLMDSYRLRDPIREMAEGGKPIWGTCAGMIMISRGLRDERVNPLNLMDIKVNRNAFGRQIDSFETELPVPALGDPPFRALFIRAPVIEETEDGVEVLARLADGRIVAARQGRLLATAFHPELTGDSRFHRYFLEMIEE